jgi:multiple sugar transport system substrate-binding protein
LENGLEDLSRYGALEHADRYDEWQWLQASYVGGHYGLPVDSGPLMYFHRADKYREWGLDGAPATWEEYAEAARRVAAAEDGAAIETFPVGDADWLAGMCMQAGAQWFGTEGGEWTVDFLDDASVRVAEFWEGLVREGVLDLAHPVWSTGWFQGLQQGRIGTWTVGSWGDTIIRGNDPDNPGRWEVAPLPQWDTGTRREGVWGESASVVLTGAPHPHEAVRFAHWLSTDQRAVDAMITECGIGWAASIELNENPVRNQRPDPYFSDQNYTAIVAEATEHISTDWVWGPTLSAARSVRNSSVATWRTWKGPAGICSCSPRPVRPVAVDVVDDRCVVWFNVAALYDAITAVVDDSFLAQTRSAGRLRAERTLFTESVAEPFFSRR